MFHPMRSADVPPSGNNSDSDDSDSSPPPLVWSESDSDGDSDSSSSSGVLLLARAPPGVDVTFDRATEDPIGMVPHFAGHTHNDADAFFSFMITLAQHARAVARACNSPEP